MRSRDELDCRAALSEAGARPGKGGYGALLGFLRRAHPECAVDYLGIDLSEEMVRLATLACAGDGRAAAVLGEASPRAADYSVASGIFNVCLEAGVGLGRRGSRGRSRRWRGPAGLGSG